MKLVINVLWVFFFFSPVKIDIIMEFSVEDFKKDYHQHGSGDIEAQLPHLQRLAEKYIGRAEETGDWVNYVKVSNSKHKA